jgi:DNA-binding transcriptional MocR family regulator
MRESSLVDGGIYGGYFVWLKPSNGLPSQLIAEQAIKQENLVIGFGNLFEVSGDEASAGFDKEIRLCFAWEDPDNIVEGVARLGKLLKRMQDNREHYQSLPVPVLDDSFVDNFK